MIVNYPESGVFTGYSSLCAALALPEKGKVDAEKEHYPHYYELGMKLLKPGKIMIADNIFRDGEGANKDNNSQETRGIRELSNKAMNDPDTIITPLLFADGILLIYKKT